ncbi:MAG: AlbA family DNA-binding domain-containing protein [Candidatus Heimdallarchaeaceae archaeon]
MSRANDKLKEYRSLFRNYKLEQEQIEIEQENKKRTKRVMPDLFSFTFGVRKKYTREAMKFIPSEKDEPFENWKRAFERDFRGLEIFLSECIILNVNGTKSPRSPVSYISSVHRVKLPKTKISRVLEGIEKLLLLGDSLIYEEDYVPKERRKFTKEEKRSPICDLWDKIQMGEIDSVVKLDEGECFERKKQGVKSQKIEKTIVAMANTTGGIIAFGYSDDKKPCPLTNSQRDGIQKQITNICRKNINPPLTPSFKTIIHKNDEGFLFVFIPEKTQRLHATTNYQFLKRVGSNNVPMTSDEVGEFYEKKK